MDRGFGGYYRGNNQTFRRDDRRGNDTGNFLDRDRRNGNFGGGGRTGSNRVSQKYF